MAYDRLPAKKVLIDWCKKVFDEKVRSKIFSKDIDINIEIAILSKQRQ